MRLVIEIPGVHTTTPGNSRKAWQVEARKARQQRLAAFVWTRDALNRLTRADRDALLSAPRLKVQLTRIGARPLDVPNVFGALKACIDGMADAIGKNDRDPWYDWQMPTQEKGETGVRITLTAENSQ